MTELTKGVNDLISWCKSNNKEYLLDEWSYEKNQDLNLDMIACKSGKYAWWKCSDCGHEYRARISHRTDGSNCPYCSGKKVSVGFNDLASFSSKLIQEWDYEKNGDLKPTDVTKCSRKKVYWICSKGHSWEARIDSRVAGSECPYCTHRRILPGSTDFATKNPDIAKQWDYDANYPVRPEDIGVTNHTKFIWKCPYCNNKWSATVVTRLRNNECPICGYLPSGK